MLLNWSLFIGVHIRELCRLHSLKIHVQSATTDDNLNTNYLKMLAKLKNNSSFVRFACALLVRIMSLILAC